MRLSAQTTDGMPGAAPIIPVPGYVILLNGDTIHGKLVWKLKYIENNPAEIRFIDDKGVSTVYDATEIVGFGQQLMDWAEDDPVPYLLAVEDYLSLASYKRKEPVFMHRLMGGKMTVFQNRFAALISKQKTEATTRMDGIDFELIPGDGLHIGPRYRTEIRIIEYRSHFTSYFVSKDHGPLVKVEKENYNELFPTLFGDCTAIEQELKINPDLNKFVNFMMLAEIYNQLCN